MVPVSVIVVILILFIAAALIGREARRLDAQPPNPTFDLTEAVEWIADHLPFEVSAELSHDDVRQIVDWSLEYFRLKGVSGNGSSSHPQTTVVVLEADTVDYVMGRSNELGAEYSTVQVRAVVDAQMGYLQSIGAIGPPVDPEEPGSGSHP